MTYQHSNIKILYVFTLVLLLFIGCEDEQKPFPYVYIDVTFDIGTELGNLAIGEYIFLGSEDCSDAENCGYGGLIIYRSGQDIYQAFDRACPTRPEEKCILEPFEGDESNNLLSCPCCGSLFDLGDSGRTIQGPAATRGLKQYEAYKKGSQLWVTNPN